MEKRNERRERREGERGVLLLLSELAHRCSELLCASILLEDPYGELSGELERMAQTEAELFRILGRVTLRRGMNPPLRLLSYGGRGRVPTLSSAEDACVSRFLGAMRKATEQMTDDARRLLTSPDWEGIDGGERFLEMLEAQGRRLRMLTS